MTTRARRRIEQRTEANREARNRAVDVRERPRRVSSKPQLEQLYGRGSITMAQRNAGERLYRDYHLSGSEQRVTSTMEPSIGIVGQGMTEAQADADARYHGALKAIGRLSAVLVAVCLLDEAPGDWAESTGRKRPDGPALLRHALDLLRDHYDGATDYHGQSGRMAR